MALDKAAEALSSKTEKVVAHFGTLGLIHHLTYAGLTNPAARALSVQQYRDDMAEEQAARDAYDEANAAAEESYRQLVGCRHKTRGW